MKQLFTALLTLTLATMNGCEIDQKDACGVDGATQHVRPVQGGTEGPSRYFLRYCLNGLGKLHGIYSLGSNRNIGGGGDVFVGMYDNGKLTSTHFYTKKKEAVLSEFVIPGYPPADQVAAATDPTK